MAARRQGADRRVSECVYARLVTSSVRDTGHPECQTSLLKMYLISISIQLGNRHIGRSAVTAAAYGGAVWARPCTERKRCLRGPKVPRGQQARAACGLLLHGHREVSSLGISVTVTLTAVRRGVARPDYGRQPLLCALALFHLHHSPTRAQRRAGKRWESQALS